MNAIRGPDISPTVGDLDIGVMARIARVRKHDPVGRLERALEALAALRTFDERDVRQAMANAGLEFQVEVGRHTLRRLLRAGLETEAGSRERTAR